MVLVMEALIPMFEKASGKKVTFIPGSSGKLAAQLREGAPFDVFLSANVKFVDDVIAERCVEVKNYSRLPKRVPTFPR